MKIAPKQLQELGSTEDFKQIVWDSTRGMFVPEWMTFRVHQVSAYDQVSTNSSTYVDVPNMTIAGATHGGGIGTVLLYIGQWQGAFELRIRMGIQIGNFLSCDLGCCGSAFRLMQLVPPMVLSSSDDVKLQWRNPSGQTCYAIQRALFFVKNWDDVPERDAA